MDVLFILRAIFGSIFVLFVPGFAWSFVFFNREQINIVERITLSFGLSIALVVLSIFLLNGLADVAITEVSSAVTIASLTIIALLCYYLKRKALPQRIADSLRKRRKR